MRCHAGMNNAGFTLIEVVIVILMVGVLAGITFPRIGGVQTSFALRGSLNAFMSAHSLARTTALRQGGVAELHIDPTHDRFWVEVDTSLAGGGLTDTVGFVIDVSDERVDLGSNQTLLCFDARGLPASDTGCATSATEITFTRDGVADTIRTTVLGKILR